MGQQPCRILVGTSGYSYTEWTEAGFYPPGTRSTGMLAHYARRFSVTELNYTWYQMPKAETVARQCAAAPESFLFAVKLTRSLTHDVDPDNWRLDALRYRDGISPLMQAERLAAVLVQLAPGFDRSRSNRLYLALLLDELHGLPLAIEFRHRSWLSDRVFAELERRRVTLVSVDEPALANLLPPTDIVTNPDLFYVRLHGRNHKGWGSGNMQQQFDYDYSQEELTEWADEKVEKMAQRAKRGVIFFNNHVRAQAPRNAGTMIRLLRQRGLSVVGSGGEGEGEHA